MDIGPKVFGTQGDRNQSSCRPAEIEIEFAGTDYLLSLLPMGETATKPS